MQPADVLDSRFHVEAEVGAGAMGVVYRARDTLDGRTVAIKVVKANVASTPRFQREARVLARLEHPAIVRYVAHGTTPRGAYIAMEWVEGEDLETHLRGGALAVEDALALARRVADALAAAHARGIVHRDLKPSNLVLPGGDPRAVKLLDFGVARVLDATNAMTAVGAVIGTPGYMAPEQARGDARIDARADVFALGCVLFECLAGRAAFLGDNVVALLAKIVLDDPPRASELRPGLPRAVDDLVAHLLAKAPSQRPRDGAAARDAIAEVEAAIATGEAPVPSRRPGVITHGEQQVVSVVIAARAVPEAKPARPQTEVLDDAPPPFTEDDVAHLSTDDDTMLEQPLPAFDAVAKLGGRVERLADGALVVTVQGAGVATDQAAQAARCAIALRKELPEAPIVLATGRGVVTGRMPLGPVIEKAAAMLRALPPLLGAGSAPIHLDEVTAALLPSRFRVRPGPSGPELEEERVADVARTLLGRATPFVGRDPEMSTFLGVFSQVEGESVARAVVVTGAPGLGKSRLREELVAKLHAREDAPSVWMAAAEPLGSGAPFGLVARGLRSALGIVDESRAAIDRARLLRRIERVLTDAATAERVTTFIGELLGVRGDASDVLLEAARREPALMAEQIQRAFVDLLLAACERGPVVLVLEDAHWADAPTMKLIDVALRELAEKPLLVALFARPEIEDAFPGLFADRSALRITLGPLTPRASERLAREILGAAEPDALKRVVQQAAGHPFFLEELLRAMAGGVVGTMPESLLAIVQARLETHDEEARRIMRAASVFGVVFWRAGVAALVGGGREDAVQRRIDELTIREVFVRRGESRLHEQVEVAFRHALVRDAAYAMLTDSDRALAHRLAGEWLEGAGETNAALLAEHFELGGEKERAIASWRAAAAHALEADDLAGALRFAERGLALAPEGEELGRLRLVHAEALRFRGDLARACDEGDAALTLLPRGSRDWVRALGVTLAASVTTGRVARALELTDALVAESTERSDAFFMTAARGVSFLLGMGQQEAAERLFALLPIAADEPMLAARIHVARAMHAHVLQADTMKLRDEMTRAADAFDRAGDVRSGCSARSNAGFASFALGRIEEAERLLRGALAGAKERGAANVAVWAAHMLGLVVGGAEAIELEKEALGAARKQGDKRLEVAAGVALARLFLGIGSVERAEEGARSALEAAGDAPFLRASALAALTDVLLEKRANDEALAVARSAIELLEGGAAIEDAEPWVRAAYADALHATGRVEGARNELAAACGRIEEQAARLPTDDDRARFRSGVAIHARILQRRAAWSTEAS